MKVEFWVVGDLKEDYALAGIKRFHKSLMPLCAVQKVIIPEGKRGESEERKREESQRILKALNPRDWLILFDERGENFSSPQFAQKVNFALNESQGKVVFLIGGPWGVDDEVRCRANTMVSLSSFVLPHELATVVAFEAVYRCFSILKGTKYHHS